MPWFRVDDSFYDHPKAIAAGDALSLWLRAGCWSAKQLTDGFVPADMLPTFRANTRRAQQLVNARARPDGAGLWVPTLGGWLFHDWADYQPSRDETETKRVKRALAGRTGGLASARARQANAQANRSTTVDPPYIPPTRPVPYPNETADAVSPSGSADGAAPTAQTLIAEWIDHCPGGRPPGRVVGQVGRELGGMLAEGIPAADVRAGLAAWHQRALHPSALASVVHELRVGVTATRTPRRSTTDERVAAGLALAAKYDAEDGTGPGATIHQLALGGTT